MYKSTVGQHPKPKGRAYCDQPYTSCYYNQQDICVNCGRKKGHRHAATLQSVPPEGGATDQGDQQPSAAEEDPPRTPSGGLSPEQIEALVYAASDLQKAARKLRQASKIAPRGVISRARQRRLILEAVHTIGLVGSLLTVGD